MFDYDDTRVRVFLISERIDIEDLFDDSVVTPVRNGNIIRITNYILEGVGPDYFENYLQSVGIYPVGDTDEPDDDCYEWAGCNEFNVYTHNEQHEKDWLK